MDHCIHHNIHIMYGYTAHQITQTLRLKWNIVVSNVHLKFPLVVYSHKTPEVIWPVPFLLQKFMSFNFFHSLSLVFYYYYYYFFFFIIIPILKAKVDAKFGQSSLQIQKRDKTWLS